jgi:hypothetical protein
MVRGISSGRCAGAWLAADRYLEKDSGVSVEVTDVGGHVDQQMDAFAECQAGRRTCPTEEYRKLASLKVEAADDRVTLALEAKPDETFDTAEIARCLDYTTAKVADAPPHA